MNEKCKFPHGVVIKPNGRDPLDPCRYKDIEKYTNVTLTVSKCVVCGHIDISWEKTEDTEYINLEEEQ